MRPLGRSLRTRIVRTTAVVSAVAMAAMIGTVVLALSAVTHNSVRSTLADRFAVISSGVENDADGPAQALQTPDDAIDDTTWLFDSGGSQLDGPHASKRVQAVADGLARVSTKTAVERRERVFLAAPVTIRGADSGRGVLVVSESLEPYETTREELIIGLVLLGLLVTAGATGIAAWTVSRTLGPVESMAALAEDWSERALDARFDDLGAQDEIAHLGHTLNLLLDRVASALRGEQQLTAELAHELRTPLTAIRGEAELALMKGLDPDTEQRLSRVLSSVDRMSTTITTLLALARGHEELSMRTTLADVVAATLEGRPGQTNLRVVGAPSAGVAVAATTEIAVRALAPLVDNAARYAATRVDISTAVTDRTVDITVSDDGPGLSDADAEDIFLAGARDSGSPGAGLGLPLARRVARTLGGEVQVTSAAAPTSFTLTLPRS